MIRFENVSKLEPVDECSYARPAQPGPNRTRLCEPYIVAIAGD